MYYATEINMQNSPDCSFIFCNWYQIWIATYCSNIYLLKKRHKQVKRAVRSQCLCFKLRTGSIPYAFVWKEARPLLRMLKIVPLCSCSGDCFSMHVYACFSLLEAVINRFFSLTSWCKFWILLPGGPRLHFVISTATYRMNVHDCYFWDVP